MDPWLLLAFLVVPLALIGAAAVVVRFIIRLERLIEGRCPSCGYEDVADRACPECGKRRRVRLARGVALTLGLLGLALVGSLYAVPQVVKGHAIRALPSFGVVWLFPEPDGRGGREILRRDDAGWPVPGWVRRVAPRAPDVIERSLVAMLARAGELEPGDEALAFGALDPIGGSWDQFAQIAASDVVTSAIEREVRTGEPDLSRVGVVEQIGGLLSNPRFAGDPTLASEWLMIAAADPAMDDQTAAQTITFRGDVQRLRQRFVAILRRPLPPDRAAVFLQQRTDFARDHRMTPTSWHRNTVPLSPAELRAIVPYASAEPVETRLRVTTLLPLADDETAGEALRLAVSMLDDDDAIVRDGAAFGVITLATEATREAWEPALRRFASGDTDNAPMARDALQRLDAGLPMIEPPESREARLDRLRRQRGAELERRRREALERRERANDGGG